MEAADEEEEDISAVIIITKCEGKENNYIMQKYDIVLMLAEWSVSRKSKLKNENQSVSWVCCEVPSRNSIEKFHPAIFKFFISIYTNMSSNFQLYHIQEHMKRIYWPSYGNYQQVISIQQTRNQMNECCIRKIK